MSSAPLLLTTGKPLIQLWFGNFFEPWLSDRTRMATALTEIRDLGFNAITLDSKPWEDFFARYRGEPASRYVATQEFMLAEAHRLGLGHSYLALYLNGDNLFPDLRDVPAVRGEEAIGADGKSLDTYKYWSEKAQATMVDHVAGLLRLYGAGHVSFEGSGPRLPMHTMFDPIIKPSFDDEGRNRYLSWLKARYAGDISIINSRYATSATDFYALTPAEYWLRPEELHYCTCAYPTGDDVRDRTPSACRWIDNQTWLAEETERFFAEMKRKLRGIDPRLFLFPVLAQWGMHFSPPGNRWWDIATRAIDPYRIAPHVDSTLFIAAPLNPEDDADAHVLSVEFSIMRNANAGRPFIAGLFLGRHVHRDVYRSVSPSEAIGVAALHGAAGLHAYGYGGADDGGVIQHLDSGFKESLTLGNQWAKRVLPRVSGQARRKDVAILFPQASHLFEPLLNQSGRQHRMDILGWYRQVVDLGLTVDVLHPDQIAAGMATEYRIIIMPTDVCYEFMVHSACERVLEEWVRAGGVCIHGPDNAMAHAAFGIREQTVDFDCVTVGDRVLIPDGWTTTAYPDAECLAPYHRLGGTAMGRTMCGRGHVVSIGYPHGFAYSTRRQPVPRGYHGDVETIGVQLLDRHPIVDILLKACSTGWSGRKGLELGWFAESLVVVNHSHSPVSVADLVVGARLVDWQCEVGYFRLIPHSAVYISFV